MKGKIKTKKKFGQHFLVSQGVIQKIVDQINVQPEDIIVEIGVGTGQLTQEILKRKPKKVYGIEIDPEVYPLIEERFRQHKNFTLIKKDFFDVDITSLDRDKKLKVVGNLPYNVASLILVNLPFFIERIELCVFMIQKEVAQKLVAKPKTKDYTFLSVFIQTYFDVQYIMSVPARFFSPPPRVTSAVVKLLPKKEIPQFDAKGYKNFVSHLFHSRRKMLRTKLEKHILEKAGINPASRVEELSVDDFVSLYSEYLLSKKDSKNQNS